MPEQAAKLLTIPQFVRHEPAISSEQRVYQMIRERILPDGVVVRMGRRIFINPSAWEEFKASGGSALAGGWRRVAA